MRNGSKNLSDEVTVSRLKELYRYDAQQGALVNKRTQRVVRGRNLIKRYKRIVVYDKGIQREVKIHQAVWALHHGRMPTTIDHINGDIDDNRIENLREVTNEESDQNRIWKWKPNRDTGLTGVHPWKNGWFEIRMHGKKYFRNPFEAFFLAIITGRMFTTD